MNQDMGTDKSNVILTIYKSNADCSAIISSHNVYVLDKRIAQLLQLDYPEDQT